MSSWLPPLRRLAADAEDHFDRLKFDLKQQLGCIDPVQIVPFYGFGDDDAVWIKGRVLEDKGIVEATDNDTLWDNLVRTYRRFESDEIPFVRLRCRFAGEEQVVETDGEGFFEVRFEPDRLPDPDELWHEASFELLDEVVPDQGTVTATGRILVPPADAAFGVISDVDDTIMKTSATSLLQMARITFLNNARTRLPFHGVAAFYRALRAGADGRGHNPVFYVSSSPWNLFDLLAGFLRVQDIPDGPLLLRDLGLTREHLLKSSHADHKLAQIERVLSTYPDLPFVLLGDSGQHDPEIYEQVVERHGTRIRAVYIRDVTTAGREAEVHAVAERVRARGVEMLLSRDSAAAAEHAAAQGLIQPERVQDVQAERAADEAAPSEMEQLLGME